MTISEDRTCYDHCNDAPYVINILSCSRVHLEPRCGCTVCQCNDIQYFDVYSLSGPILVRV